MVFSASGDRDGKQAAFPGSVLPQVDPRKLLEPEASDDDDVADDDCVSIAAMCGDNHIPTADRLHNERLALENLMEPVPLGWQCTVGRVCLGSELMGGARDHVFTTGGAWRRHAQKGNAMNICVMGVSHATAGPGPLQIPNPEKFERCRFSKCAGILVF